MGNSDRQAAAAADRLLAGVTRLGSRMRAERPPTGLSMAMLGVLLRLSYRDSLTAGELAGSSRITPQSMTRILASLEERGLIARRTNPDDARQSLISLTERAYQVMDEDGRARRRWLAAAMAAELTPAERELLRIAGQLMLDLADWDGPVE